MRTGNTQTHNYNKDTPTGPMIILAKEKVGELRLLADDRQFEREEGEMTRGEAVASMNSRRVVSPTARSRRSSVLCESELPICCSRGGRCVVIATLALVVWLLTNERRHVPVTRVWGT